MTDDKLRDELAEALIEWIAEWAVVQAANDLLPVVRRAQARALREAADAFGRSSTGPEHYDETDVWLRDRADEIAADERERVRETLPDGCGTAEEIHAEMTAAYAAIAARCTCSGGWDQHDDEANCPNSPECICGPFFAPFCSRHGDPEPLS